ncbi:MAG: hypothetical protein U0559_05355 [Anaerolineae bacterium]
MLYPVGKVKVSGAATCAVSIARVIGLIVRQTVGGAGVAKLCRVRWPPPVRERSLPLDRFDAAKPTTDAGYIQMTFDEFSLNI